jgi:hypothetical protein
MHLPRAPWEKTLVFIALLDVAALAGFLLGAYHVREDKLDWGILIPFFAFLGIEIKTGNLLIGRYWNRVLATKDKNPRLYWTVISIESALCLLVIYELAIGKHLPH